MISSLCFPEDVVILKLLNDAIGPKLTSCKELTSPYLSLSAFLITSKG